MMFTSLEFFIFLPLVLGLCAGRAHALGCACWSQVRFFTELRIRSISSTSAR